MGSPREEEMKTAFCSLVVQSDSSVVDLGWVDFDFGVPYSCPFVQPLRPNSHKPRQNWADSRTPKIKVNPSNVHQLMEHPVVRLVGHVDLVVLCLLGIMSHYSAASFGSAFKSSPPVVPIHRSHRPLPLWPPPREQKGHL